MLQLKNPFKDGTTHIVMSHLEFLQRLAALVSRTRLNLIRFHGALSPNAKLRPEIISNQPATIKDISDESDNASDHARAARFSWARLLKRVFDIDVEHCPHCGGNLKIIAAIEQPSVIAKILARQARSWSFSRSLTVAAVPGTTVGQFVQLIKRRTAAAWLRHQLTRQDGVRAVARKQRKIPVQIPGYPQRAA